MPRQYYLRRGNKTVGPLSPENLRAGIKSKKYLSNDELSVSEAGGFAPLKEVYELAIGGEWDGVVDPSPKLDDLLVLEPIDDVLSLESIDLPELSRDSVQLTQTPSWAERQRQILADQERKKEGDASSHWPLTTGVAAGTLVVGLIVGSVVGYALKGPSNKNYAAGDSSSNPSGRSAPERGTAADPKAEFIALLKGDNSQNKKFDITVSDDSTWAMVIKNTVTYDVKKTSSLVAPYSAVISFAMVFEYEINFMEPQRARVLKDGGGLADLGDNGNIYRAFFEYKNGEWLYTGGHDRGTFQSWDDIAAKPKTSSPFVNKIISQVITIRNP